MTSTLIWSSLQTILHALRHNIQLPSIYPHTNSLPPYLRHYLPLAWHDQSQIGFEHILKGRLSTKWRLAQQCAYDHYPSALLKNIILENIGLMPLWLVS